MTAGVNPAAALDFTRLLPDKVALVTDAVAGVPREYADAVIEHTLAPLATRVTAAEVVTVWAR